MIGFFNFRVSTIVPFLKTGSDKLVSLPHNVHFFGSFNLVNDLKIFCDDSDFKALILVLVRDRDRSESGCSSAHFSILVSSETKCERVVVHY